MDLEYFCVAKEYTSVGYGGTVLEAFFNCADQAGTNLSMDEVIFFKGTRIKVQMTVDICGEQ